MQTVHCAARCRIDLITVVVFVCARIWRANTYTACLSSLLSNPPSYLDSRVPNSGIVPGHEEYQLLLFSMHLLVCPLCTLIHSLMPPYADNLSHTHCCLYQLALVSFFSPLCTLRPLSGLVFPRQ